MKRYSSIGTTILLVGLSLTAENLSGSAITSGTINIPSANGIGTFSLSGSGFTVAGSFFVGESLWSVIDSCRPCSSGDSLDVDGNVSGTGFFGGGGSATIGATSYSVAWSDLLANGASGFTVTGLPITVNTPGTYTGSFSFTGYLCGSAGGNSGYEHPCIVDLRGLTGSGQVSVNVVQDIPGLLRGDSATYTFTSVPEPSAFVFIATAALIFLVGRKALNVREAQLTYVTVTRKRHESSGRHTTGILSNLSNGVYYPLSNVSEAAADSFRQLAEHRPG